MMEVSAAAKTVAAIVTSIGVIGGGALTMDSRHVAQDDYDEYVASNRVQTILQLAKDSRDEGGPEYLCRALQAEFIALCSEQPGHYFCSGQEGTEAKKEILAKAQCD